MKVRHGFWIVEYGPERFALRANVPAVRRESRDGDAAADCLPDDH